VGDLGQPEGEKIIEKFRPAGGLIYMVAVYIMSMYPRYGRGPVAFSVSILRSLSFSKERRTMAEIELICQEIKTSEGDSHETTT